MEPSSAESFRRDARVIGLVGMAHGLSHFFQLALPPLFPLNANVAAKRLGHAYSTHGVGGNLGYALAPVVSFALASAIGWRGALAAMGAIGLVAWGAIATLFVVALGTVFQVRRAIGARTA